MTRNDFVELTGPEARVLIAQIEECLHEMRLAILGGNKRAWALCSTRFEVLSEQLNAQITIPLE